MESSECLWEGNVSPSPRAERVVIELTVQPCQALAADFLPCLERPGVQNYLQARFIGSGERGWVAVLGNQVSFSRRPSVSASVRQNCAREANARARDLGPSDPQS